MTPMVTVDGEDTAITELSASGHGVIAHDRLPRGTRVGRYIIVELIGRGGMGVVYRAWDPELCRDVALKLLRPDRRNPEALDAAKKRMRREATAMARISHPNVLPVYDVGLFEHRFFIAMELVPSRLTLGDWVEHHRPSWPEIVAKYVEAARGLAAAHAVGFVHRDFKPHNVLLGCDGRARVMDFGLVRPWSPDETEPEVTLDDSEWVVSDVLETQLTAAGSVVGTPRYMAPEQHRGALADARCDQFSLCVALFEALYGVRPYGRGDPRQVGRRKALGKIAARPQGTDVPMWLHEVVVRGLAPRPVERWPSMEALIEALQTRPARARRRHGWLVAGALAGAMVGAVPTVWWLSTTRDVPVEVSPTRSMPAQRLARAAVELGRDDLAIDVLTSMLAEPGLTPSRRADLRLQLGSSFARQGRLGEALEHHRAALEMREQAGAEPSRVADVLDAMALDLRRLGRLQEAEHAVERALALRSPSPSADPRLIDTHLELARLRAAQGRHDEAVKGFELAIGWLSLGDDDDRLLDALVDWAGALEATGDHGLATAALERAVATSGTPRSRARARFALARVLVKIDRPRARALAELALATYDGLGDRQRRNRVTRWLADA